MVQRFGAVLVALVGLYFASIPFVPPYSGETISNDEQTSRTINYHGKMIGMAHQNVSVLAASLSHSLEKQGQQTPEAIRSLAEPVLSSDYRSIDSVGWDEHDKEATKVSIGRLLASRQLERTNSNRARSQAFFLAIGTLQWGFGDMPFAEACIC